MRSYRCRAGWRSILDFLWGFHVPVLRYLFFRLGVGRWLAGAANSSGYRLVRYALTYLSSGAGRAATETVYAGEVPDDAAGHGLCRHALGERFIHHAIRSLPPQKQAR